MRFSEVELGDDLPETHPDISMEKVRLFVKAAYMDFPRFTDHDFARSEGLPGAIVPGVRSSSRAAILASPSATCCVTASRRCPAWSRCASTTALATSSSRSRLASRF